jgi:hypothetical protein
MRLKNIIIISLGLLFFLLGSEKYFRIRNKGSFLRPSNALNFVAEKSNEFFYNLGKYSVKLFYYLGHFIPELTDVVNILYYVFKIMLSPLQFIIGFYDFVILKEQNRLALSGFIGFVVICGGVIMYLLHKHGYLYKENN